MDNDFRTNFVHIRNQSSKIRLVASSTSLVVLRNYKWSSSSIVVIFFDNFKNGI
jgi:hypothetical protein